MGTRTNLVVAVPCAAVLTLLLPLIACAQPRAQEGDLVRVRTHDGGTAIGVFERRRQARLIIAPDGRGLRVGAQIRR